MGSPPTRPLKIIPGGCPMSRRRDVVINFACVAFIALVLVFVLEVLKLDGGYGAFPVDVRVVDASAGEVMMAFYQVVPTEQNASEVADRLPATDGFSDALLSDEGGFSIGVPYRQKAEYFGWQAFPFFHFRKVAIVFIMVDGTRRFIIADIPKQQDVPENPVAIRVSLEDARQFPGD